MENIKQPVIRKRERESGQLVARMVHIQAPAGTSAHVDAGQRKVAAEKVVYPCVCARVGHLRVIK